MDSEKLVYTHFMPVLCDRLMGLTSGASALVQKCYWEVQVKFARIGWLCVALCGCASGAFKVASPDWASGYYPAQHAANVATAIDVQLDAQRELLLLDRGYFTHTMV